MTARLPWRATPDGLDLAVRLSPRGGPARVKRLHPRGDSLGPRLTALLEAK